MSRPFDHRERAPPATGAAGVRRTLQPCATAPGARTVGANALPRDVAVVLDRSGSMCLFTHGGPKSVCEEVTGLLRLPDALVRIRHVQAILRCGPSRATIRCHSPISCQDEQGASACGCSSAAALELPALSSGDHRSWQDDGEAAPALNHGKRRSGLRSGRTYSTPTRRSHSHCQRQSARLLLTSTPPSKSKPRTCGSDHGQTCLCQARVYFQKSQAISITRRCSPVM